MKHKAGGLSTALLAALVSRLDGTLWLLKTLGGGVGMYTLRTALMAGVVSLGK